MIFVLVVSNVGPITFNTGRIFLTSNLIFNLNNKTMVYPKLSILSHFILELSIIDTLHSRYMIFIKLN